MRRRGLALRDLGDLAGAAADLRRALRLCDVVSPRSAWDFRVRIGLLSRGAGGPGRAGRIGRLGGRGERKEAARAMEWLHRAVAIGYRNTNQTPHRVGPRPTPQPRRLQEADGRAGEERPATAREEVTSGANEPRVVNSHYDPTATSLRRLNFRSVPSTVEPATAYQTPRQSSSRKLMPKLLSQEFREIRPLPRHDRRSRPIGTRQRPITSGPLSLMGGRVPGSRSQTTPKKLITRDLPTRLPCLYRYSSSP